MAGLKINEDEESFELPETVTTRLKCGNCGHVGRYDVGQIYVNPNVMKRDDEDFSNFVAFSGYFRCRKCKSAGPWEFTSDAKMAVMAAMILKKIRPDNNRLIFAIPALFDGTPCKSAAYGEDYLKSILDKDPDNAFVWSRLGNIYRSADLYPKAEKAYKKAIQLNPDDIESHYGLGKVLYYRDKLKDSSDHLHQVLKLARTNSQLSKEHLRECVSDTLNTLIEISERTDNEIPLLGNFDLEKIEATSDEPLVLTTRNYDLSSEDDWESMIDIFTGEATRKNPDVLSQTKQKKVSRNSPCPCGSGKKYKKCCG